VHGIYTQMGAVTFSVQLLNLFLSKQFHSLKPAFCVRETCMLNAEYCLPGCETN